MRAQPRGAYRHTYTHPPTPPSAYLSLAANPADDVAFLRVANVPPRKLGKTTTTKLVDEAGTLRVAAMAEAMAAAVPGYDATAAATGGATRKLTAMNIELMLGVRQAESF